MARKSRLTATLDKAIESASQDILTSAIAGMPAQTSLGDLYQSLTKSQFSEQFKSMTIGDLAAAVNGAAKPATRARAAAKPRAATAARKRETRSLAGREAFDAEVRAFLQAQSSPVRAEAIRGVVGGSAAQVRQSLDRMRTAGQVTRKGQKRATEYSWKGTGSKSRKKATGGGRRKTGRRKTTK